MRTEADRSPWRIRSSRPSSSASISILPWVEAMRELEVADAGHGVGLAQTQRPAHGVGRQGLVVGDAEAHRDARALVDVRALAGQLGELGHDLGHEVGDLDPGPALGADGRPRLLVDDGELGVGVLGVVGADLGAEAVLEGRDDPAPVGVVLGVGRRHQHDVEGQPDGEAADLDVALLEHVEQAHLDPLGQVGELVDGEDPPVRPRHQAVVQGQLVGEVAALGDLDGVDLADEVRDGGVGRGQLLREAEVPVHPPQRGVVALARPRGRGPWRDTGK